MKGTRKKSSIKQNKQTKITINVYCSLQGRKFLFFKSEVEVMLQLGDAVLGHFVTGKEEIRIFFFVYPLLRRFTTNDVCISHGQSREVVILLKGRIKCCCPQMSYFTPISSGGKGYGDQDFHKLWIQAPRVLDSLIPEHHGFVKIALDLGKRSVSSH